MCLSFTDPAPIFFTSLWTFLWKTLIIFDFEVFPNEAVKIYFPATSPTNLPSCRINPDAELLLSKDFPVNEYLILTSLIRLPLLSYASAFKFTTSPVLTFSGFCKLKLILATGFFSIFIVLDDLIPTKTTVIVADPDSKAKTLLDSAKFNLSLD